MRDGSDNRGAGRQEYYTQYTKSDRRVKNARATVKTSTLKQRVHHATFILYHVGLRAERFLFHVINVWFSLNCVGCRAQHESMIYILLQFL